MEKERPLSRPGSGSPGSSPAALNIQRGGLPGGRAGAPNWPGLCRIGVVCEHDRQHVRARWAARHTRDAGTVQAAEAVGPIEAVEHAVRRLAAAQGEAGQVAGIF